MKTSSRREFLKSTGTALAGWGALSVLGSRKASAAPPGGGRPNLLLVFPDQLRPDWTSLNPAVAVRTPHLARLAREGMRFERAYCPSPLCAPSRACLAQGRAYGSTGVWSNGDDNPDGVRTFYQGLREAGYRVACIGKADLRKKSYDWGPDGLHRVGERVYFREWGFTDGFDSEGKIDVVLGVQKQRRLGLPLNPYAGMLERRGDGSLKTYLGWYRAFRSARLGPGNYAYTTPCALPDPAYNDNWVGANALGLLEEELPAGRPWFLQVNFPGPHNPEDITPSMAAWTRGRSYPQPIANDQLAPEAHVRIRRNYSAMVENIDRWLGRFLEALERRGERDRTLVVFSSDHGEMLGDHDRWGKTVPYQASASVPLVVRGPGVPPGSVHAKVATTLDLSATFLDFAGAPVPASMDSRSLRPALAGDPAAGRSHVASGLGSWRLVCDGRFKLVSGFDPAARPSGPEQAAARVGAGRDAPALLFDLAADPDELENVAARHPDAVARLAAWMPRAPRRHARA